MQRKMSMLAFGIVCWVSASLWFLAGIADAGSIIGRPRGVGGGASTAAQVSITDSGDYFVGTNVESALQELGEELENRPIFNPLDYGAYCDGTSHPIVDVSEYKLPNGKKLYDAVWTAGGSYTQHQRVLGSDGAIYVAVQDENGMVDPTAEAISTYWWKLFEDGDEADYVAVQYLLGEGSVQLPQGECLALSNKRPLTIYRGAVALQGVGAGIETTDFLYAQSDNPETYTFNPATTVLKGWGAGATADAILVAAPNVVLKDFKIFGGMTTKPVPSTLYAIQVDAQNYYAAGVKYNYASLFRFEGLVIEQCWNAIRFGEGAAMGSVHNIYIRDNGGVGVEQDIIPGSGDIDLYKLQIRNNLGTITVDNGTIGVWARRGEQLSLHQFKTWGVWDAIKIDSTADHIKNIYLYDASIEHVFHYAITDEGVLDARRLWVYGGKISNMGFGSSPYPCVHLDGMKEATFVGVDFYACSNGGAYIDTDYVNIIGSRFGWNGTGYNYVHNAGYVTTLADRVTAGDSMANIEIGPNASHILLEGNIFDDAEAAECRPDCTGDTILKNHIKIDLGATDYVIVGNSFGDLETGYWGGAAAASIDDQASDPASFIQMNAFEDNDVVELGSSSGSGISAGDTSLSINDTGTGEIVGVLDSGTTNARLSITGETTGVGGPHTIISSGDSTGRLSISAAESGAKVPRVQFVPDYDPATALRGWAIFDIGSDNGRASDPQFKVRYTNDGVLFTDLLALHTNNEAKLSLPLVTEWVWPYGQPDQYIDQKLSYNDAARDALFRANGSPDASTGILLDDILGELIFGGRYGLGLYRTAYISAKADENWGFDSYGTSMHFYTTPINEGLPREVMQLGSGGKARFFYDVQIDGSLITGLEVTDAYDFPSIPAGSCVNRTLTMTGVNPGDFLLVSPSQFVSGVTYTAAYAGTDLVTYELCNPTSAAVDPPAITYYIKGIRR